MRMKAYAVRDTTTGLFLGARTPYTGARLRDLSEFPRVWQRAGHAELALRAYADKTWKPRSTVETPVALVVAEVFIEVPTP